MMPHIIKESARGFEPFLIEDCLLQKRVIFLTEAVNAQTSSELIKQFLYLEAEQPGQEITFCINSPGGEVTGGLAVYDYMRLITSPVRTVCIGTAASMASILFLGGDKREMLPHTRVMIHDPSFSSGEYAGKKPDELQEEIDSLKKTRDILCDIIVERTGQNRKTVYEKTSRDSYFYADEALAFGLATKIITSPGEIYQGEGIL